MESSAEETSSDDGGEGQSGQPVSDAVGTNVVPKKPYYLERPRGSLIRAEKLEEDRLAREARKAQESEKAKDSD